MKSLNAKRIAAIVTGAALLGAGLAFAGPLTFQNVPIISNSGQPVVQVVIGSGAKPSDGVAAGNIAAAIGNLAYTSQPITASVNPASANALTVSVSSAQYSLANQQVWLNESGVTSATGASYLFSALIGSVLNQGVQLGAPQYTKSLQSSSQSSYVFPRSTSITSTASPYEAAGSVPTGGTVPQTSNNVGGNTGGGVYFNTFTSSTYDNILQVTHAQFSSLPTNWGANGETASLFLTGFPVFDQENSGSIQNQFALLSAGGAYEVTFNKPINILTSSGANNINVPISLLGQNYTIVNESGIASGASSTTAVNGGWLTLASSIAPLQTVYVGHNITSGPWTVQLQDLAQTTQGTNAPVAVAVYYNGALTNESSINSGTTAKFNVTGKLLYLNVNSTFAGLYAYQKWAKMQLYTGIYKLTDGKQYNTTIDNGWYVNLLWTNTSSGSKGNALKSIIIYNYTPTQLTVGESFSFIQNPASYKVTFVGDTLGNNFDAVSTSLSTGSVDVNNLGTAEGTHGNPNNITEPAQLLTVQSGISSAFTYGGQTGSKVTYDLTPYTLSYTANAGNAAYGYGTNAVLAFTDFDAGNFVNANSPLSVQIAGYSSPSASSPQTEPTVQFTSNSQTVALSFPLWNVTGIILQNGRSLPLTSTGSFTVTVTNAVNTANAMSTLAETAPITLLAENNGNNFNQSQAASSTVTYNQQNGQQTSVVLAQSTGSVTNHVRQYYNFKISEEPVPQNTSATDSLGFGIYNTTAGSSQTQVLQMNYSISGNHNNATYVSTKGYSIPVQSNPSSGSSFRTEKGSKVVSISPNGDTFDLATSVDQLQFALTNSASNVVVSKAYASYGPYSVGQATNLPNVTIGKVTATPILSGTSQYQILGVNNLTATPSVSTAIVPVLLKNLSSSAPIVVLDSQANSGSNLILVGSGYVNSLSQQLQNASLININASSTTPVVQAVGNNRILVAGYTAAQTTTAANEFIADLYNAAASSS